MPIAKLLIANRGEIAVRIARSARSLGYRTVAIFSDADAGAPHVAAADESVSVGPAPVGQSYLAVDRVLDAARRTGADALHPGYGLLSENAELARRCAEAGIVFVGPPAACIAQMADKAAAREQARRAGVPCVPGYDGPDGEPHLLAAAAELGYPVMIKAAAGGGGRGMRRAGALAELKAELPRARAEAEAAFGDGRLLLERVIERARHVEVQVLFDAHGGAVHLGERDCSVQRRFQKVIEEAPSPAVDAALRARLGAAALSLARASGYVGVGTVEFLLDEAGAFYFLEMNTRLQVEHGVTEMVTGIDLVAEQLRIADGEALGFSQGDISLRGHAIEARLYAEDPGADFLPQTGRVERFVAPTGSGVRIDHALADGLVVSAHYDPMLAKLIAHGQDRAQALRRLDAALRATVLLGVRHNRDFLRRVLAHPEFGRGAIDTGFLAGAGFSLAAEPAPAPHDLAAAALALLLREAGCDAGDELFGFANARPVAVLFRLARGQHEHVVSARREGDGFALEVDGAHLMVEDLRFSPDARRLSLRCDGIDRRYAVALRGERVELDGGRHLVLHDHTRAAPREHAHAGSGRVHSAIEANVTDVLVAEGDSVAAGDGLLVLEAMKLQHVVRAEIAGRVTHIAVAPGDQVVIGQLLVEIDD